MNFIKTKIEGVFIIEPVVHGDNRGYFVEVFRQDLFDANVAPIHFVQENQNKSSYGVLRGLHFQKPPFAQGKLAHVLDGAVLDVAVDIRKGSPTFGEYVSVELSAENHRQIFLPRGMAHGMICLTPSCVFSYNVDNPYAPQSEGFIAWDDPDLGIDWQIPIDNVILSEKDKHHPRLKDIESPFDISVDLYK